MVTRLRTEEIWLPHSPQWEQKMEVGEGPQRAVLRMPETSGESSNFRSLVVSHPYLRVRWEPKPRGGTWTPLGGVSWPVQLIHLPVSPQFLSSVLQRALRLAGQREPLPRTPPASRSSALCLSSFHLGICNHLVTRTLWSMDFFKFNETRT